MTMSAKTISAKPSRTRHTALLAPAVLVGLIGCGSSDPAGLDRNDLAAVAAEFIARYAHHDPHACELATTVLRVRLERDGRCGGGVQGQRPRVTVLYHRDCAGKAAVHLETTPAGAVGKPFADVGLVRVGEHWKVNAVLAISDRSVLQPYECAPPSPPGG